MFSLISLLFFISIVALIVTNAFFIVKQQSTVIIERWGKFNRTTEAGLRIKIPFVDKIAGELSLRIQQLEVEIETKTKDNVFVKVQVSVQYRVKETNVYDAFYKLDNGQQQIRSYVFDVVRAEVPKMILDTLFDQKEIIANAVKTELTETMQTFGYEIVKALITDIRPDEKVKHAMNEINEQQRLRLAAQEKGEAQKILIVKAAEAEAESKRLQGEGIANQRKAIIEGLRQSIDEFQTAVPDASSQDIMSLVLVTQYCDTLKDIGANNKSSTILLPHSPGALKDIAQQLQEGIIAGNLITENTKSK